MRLPGLYVSLEALDGYEQKATCRDDTLVPGCPADQIQAYGRWSPKNNVPPMCFGRK